MWAIVGVTITVDWCTAVIKMRSLGIRKRFIQETSGIQCRIKKSDENNTGFWNALLVENCLEFRSEHFERSNQQVHQLRTDASRRTVSRTPDQSARSSGNKCQLARPLTMPNFIALGQTIYEKVLQIKSVTILAPQGIHCAKVHHSGC